MLYSELTILSYHQFFAEENQYAFSRTYKQFQADLAKFDFDFITMDDAHEGIIKACEMMRALNFRAKIFVPTSLVGKRGHCTWDQLWRLSKFHDICNHSHNHVKLTDLKYEEIKSNLEQCNGLIKKHIGISPRFFVAPWNQYDKRVDEIARDLNMISLKNRVNMRNDS